MSSSEGTDGDMESRAAKRQAAIQARLEERLKSDDPQAMRAVVRGMVAKHRATWGDLEVIHHTIQVTSFGGCGTSALYDHLSAAGVDVPKTPGHAPFRHMRIPPDPKTVPAGFRVIYLYGDPRNSVLSLFRRGHGQLEDAYLNLRPEPPPEAARQRLASLEAFLGAQVDELQLEDHLERWLIRERSGYPVLFLRFESLPGTWPVVRDFVGLPPDYPPLEVRTRRSDWQSLPQPLREQIDRLYGGLARRIDDLPPVQIL
jgi:hypothetical protein